MLNVSRDFTEQAGKQKCRYHWFTNCLIFYLIIIKAVINYLNEIGLAASPVSFYFLYYPFDIFI